MNKKLLMPLGIIAASITALIAPNLGRYFSSIHINSTLIFVMFVIYGLKIHYKAFKPTRLLFKITFIVIVINLFLAPVLVKIFAGFFLQKSFLLGILLVSVTPPTLASSVMFTESAEGETTTSLLLTIILNFVAVLTIPFMIRFMVFTQKGSSYSANHILIQLFILVLVPYALGIFITNFRTFSSKNFIIQFGPLIALLLIVYTSLSITRDSLFNIHLGTLLMLVVTAFMLSCLLFFILFVCGKYFHIDTKNIKAMIFSGGTKTLPLSLLIIEFMHFTTSDAVVAAIVYYFVQLISGSLLALYLRGIPHFYTKKTAKISSAV